jgi:spore coat protein U-like protein
MPLLFRTLRWSISLLFIAAQLPLASCARAEDGKPQCSFNVTNISFGTIDPKNGHPYDATGTLNYACTGDSREIVRICPSLGIPPSGPRYMTDASGNKLFFNLYTDEARATVWGSWYANIKAPTIDVPLGRSERVTGSIIIYARVDANQQNVPAGVYSSAIKGGNSAFAYDYVSTGSCQSPIKGAGTKVSVPVAITTRVGDGGPSSQPIVAPDATHNQASGSNTINSNSPQEHNGLMQTLLANAQYQQRKNQAAVDSKATSGQAEGNGRAEYLESHSCMTSAGAQKANELAADCEKVTDAPHKSCAIQENTCDEIRSATQKGCWAKAAEGPDWCLTRYH